MTERENFLRNIRFNRPERITGHIPEHGLWYTGCHHDNLQGQGHHSPVGTSWQDIWGVTWHRDLEDVMGFPQSHPLAELEKLEQYQPPDLDDAIYHGSIVRQREAYTNKELLLSGSHRDTLWERAYMLVGMEDLMCYFYTEPELVRRLLHMIMDFQLKAAEYYLNAGVELVHLSDDMGTQSGLLLGEPIFHEFLVPEYKRLINLYKENGVLINFHSCGYIEPLLELFMELGIDMLNPVQASANNLTRVREKTQGRMALMGGISSALLMSGSRNEIRESVRDTIRLLGAQGGYICAGDQHMPFPQENLEIFWKAIEEYGRVAS